MRIRNVSRGSIYWCRFDSAGDSVQNGIRPVLVLQCDVGNRYSSTTIVAPITSVIKKPNLPCHVLLAQSFGLREPSMVLLEQMQTVSMKKLDRYIGQVTDKRIWNRIKLGLRILLELEQG